MINSGVFKEDPEQGVSISAKGMYVFLIQGSIFCSFSLVVHLFVFVYSHLISYPNSLPFFLNTLNILPSFLQFLRFIQIAFASTYINIYAPYTNSTNDFFQSQYSSSFSSVPTSTQCLVWFYLNMGNALQHYPDSKGQVQNCLVKVSQIFVHLCLPLLCLQWPCTISSEHCLSQFFLWIAASWVPQQLTNCFTLFIGVSLGPW